MLGASGHRPAGALGAAAMTGLLLCLALPAGPAVSAVNSPARTDWLGTLNAYRASAGLPPVTAVAAWSDGAAKHARYAALNGTRGHFEDAALPHYTPEGDLAARSSVIGGWSAPTDARHFLDRWVEGPFHAPGLLDPRLTRSGYGQHTAPSGATVAVLDVLRGIDGTSPFRPVVWPGHGATIPVDSYSGGESPDPLPGCGYAAPSGTPLLALLGYDPPTVPTATLTTGGRVVAHCAYDSRTYEHPDAGQEALGRQVLRSRGTFVVVPRDPLSVGGLYTLTVATTAGRYVSTFRVGARGSAIGSGSRAVFTPVTKPSATAREIGDTCDGLQSATFPDIAGNAHAYAIRCVATAGIAQGRTDGTFGPTEGLSRGQTATFLYRTLVATGVPLLPGLFDPCQGRAGVHEDALEVLIASSIASRNDCDGNLPITRGRMAEWIDAALFRAGIPRPAATADWYWDDEGHPASGAVDAITSAGIVTGKGDGSYGPDETLTRAQMATFLARTLDALGT